MSIAPHYTNSVNYNLAPYTNSVNSMSIAPLHELHQLQSPPYTNSVNSMSITRTPSTLYQSPPYTNSINYNRPLTLTTCQSTPIHELCQIHVNCPPLHELRQLHVNRPSYTNSETTIARLHELRQLHCQSPPPLHELRRIQSRPLHELRQLRVNRPLT